MIRKIKVIRERDPALIPLLILCLLFLVALGWSIYISIELEKTNNFYYNEFNRITQLIQNSPETPLYERIAQNLYAERPYDINEYNCQNMSLELTRRLNAEGYEAQRICGDYYDQNNTFVSGHCWVKLSLLLESTNSMILDPSQYKQYRS